MMLMKKMETNEYIIVPSRSLLEGASVHLSVCIVYSDIGVSIPIDFISGVGIHFNNLFHVQRL